MAKFKSLWPCPVYVATFADGTTCRMSFASPAGKPIEFGRGRRLLAWACAQLPVDRSAEVAGYKLVRANSPLHFMPPKVSVCNVKQGRFDTWENQRKPIGMRGTLVERGIGAAIPVTADGRRFTRTLRPMMPPREDMIAGHVEHDGNRYDDPHFAGQNVVALPKRRLSKAAADLDKAVAIIAALEASFGAAFPDECAAAIEFLLSREAA